MAIDDSPKATIGLPMFRQPAPATDDGSPAPSKAQPTPALAPAGRPDLPTMPESPKQSAQAVLAGPTGISSGGEGPADRGDKPARPRGDPHHAAKVVAGGVGLLLQLADAIVHRVAGRRLRKPTRERIDDFAKPTGRLLARHWDVAGALGDDVLDLAEAGAAIGAHLNDGPLTERGPTVSHLADDYGDVQAETPRPAAAPAAAPAPTARVVPAPAPTATVAAAPTVTYLS